MKTLNDYKLLTKILNRAGEMQLFVFDRISLSMDLEYADEESPIDFERLLNADDFNFSHDICGIQANFNRQTKKMDNLFVPRFTK